MNQDLALHRTSVVGYAAPAYRLYKPIGGDESSQDDESTLKCGRAWSGSDSAHSSTSELSSSSEDLGQDVIAHSADADFQWVRNSAPAAATAAAAAKPSEAANQKPPRDVDNGSRVQGASGAKAAAMAAPSVPKNFPKPPKGAAKGNVGRQKHAAESGQECSSQYGQADMQQVECRKTPVSFDKLEDLNTGKFNSNFEEFEDDVPNNRVERNKDYIQKNMETFQSQDMELSELCQNNSYLDMNPSNPQHGIHGNTSKLPPAFDKTGSLDRRRKSSNRSGRDKKCRSSVLAQPPCQSPSRFRSPSRNNQPPPPQPQPPHHHHQHQMTDYYDTKPHLRYDSNSSLCHDHVCSCCRQELDHWKSHKEELFDRHERQDPQRYGSSGLLSSQHGSRHCLLGSQHELSHCCGGGGGGGGYVPPCHSMANSCWHCSGSRWRLYKGGGLDVEERLKRLEMDKDQLQLQVAVLMEQVDAQSDKIADQEKLLADRKRQLAGTEDLLQSEMLSRSSLETQKLELLTVMSELKLQMAALDRENMELRRRQQPYKPPSGPPAAASAAAARLGAASGPVGGASLAQRHASPAPSPVSSVSEGSPRRTHHQTSMEDLKDILAQMKPPAEYKRRIDHYASLPRQRVNDVLTPPEPATPSSLPAAPGGVRKGVAFGKGISSYLQFHSAVAATAAARKQPGDRSYSTPNLAETESVVIVDRVDGPLLADEEDDLDPQRSPSQAANKSRGIKKMLGKMTRSGSANLDDLPCDGELKRGGVRATAGPRLGWSCNPQNSLARAEETRLPFVEWDCARICAWLQDMGLECYAGDARRWVKSGAQLLAASAHEIDKELGVKNPLHRKKLQLALLSHQAHVTAVDPDLRLASQLDTSWVLRWLDDTGLPQHKEAFLAARVDGRVLHRLTMDDLVTLHVTSHLHVASLRRGIQVLRTQGFEPDCLQRRSIPGDLPQVVLWTNHRVMEWLRVVDLAEYAPNLRGSGVHGGLVFYEARFTAELLASLLAIPPGKTLLRRHLNTHFKELLGADRIQEKREAEATLGYVPLTPTTKLKVVKKSQFTLKRKKSRSELEFGDLVCPLDPTKTDDAEPSPKGRGCLSGN